MYSLTSTFYVFKYLNYYTMKVLKEQKSFLFDCSKEIRVLKIIFLFSIFIFSNSVFSQEKLNGTYQIVSNPHNENLENYILALSTSNFECYRFETKSRILTFDSGIVIEFYSYKKITEAGFVQNKNCFLVDSTSAIDYELNLVNDKIAIKAPYDNSIKRIQNEK